MKRFVQCVCVICALISPIISSAQAWVARYNGPGNSMDEACAIVLDNVGNVYVTGYSCGLHSEEYATVKYDSIGVEQWVAQYDGSEDNDDRATAIAIDNAGNIYVTGTSVDSFMLSYYWCDYATVKYNASGLQQWVVHYEGTDDRDNWATAIAVDAASNIYVTGRSGATADYATVKYDSSGVEQWVARYNGPGNGGDWAEAIAVDAAGNIYVTGGSRGSGTGTDYATVKYDSLGVEQWVARYNGPVNLGDAAFAIAVDNAGNVYVTGFCDYDWLVHPAGDYATVKYNSAGVEQWATLYNGSGNGDDWARAIAVDNGGNVYVTGYCEGSGTVLDYATVKYDSLGVEQWVALYNGPGNDVDIANALAIDNAGNICVTGESWDSVTVGDYATVKYDTAGVEQWVARYNGPVPPSNAEDWAEAIAVDAAGNIYVTGTSCGSVRDYLTIKYSPTGVEEQKVSAARNNYLGASIFSGPLLLLEGKKCKVFDITGRVVEPDKIRPGIYFIEIDGEITQKVVKIR